MEHIAEKINMLDVEYRQLRNLVRILTYVMRYCEYESVKSIDFLDLQEIIDDKSEIFEKELEELSDDVYKKAAEGFGKY